MYISWHHIYVICRTRPPCSCRPFRNPASIPVQSSIEEDNSRGVMDTHSTNSDTGAIIALRQERKRGDLHACTKVHGARMTGAVRTRNLRRGGTPASVLKSCIDTVTGYPMHSTKPCVASVVTQKQAAGVREENCFRLGLDYNYGPPYHR